MLAEEDRPALESKWRRPTEQMRVVDQPGSAPELKRPDAALYTFRCLSIIHSVSLTHNSAGPSSLLAVGLSDCTEVYEVEQQHVQDEFGLSACWKCRPVGRCHSSAVRLS